MLSDSVPCFLYDFLTGKTKFYFPEIFPHTPSVFQKTQTPKVLAYFRLILGPKIVKSQSEEKSKLKSRIIFYFF